MTKPGEQFVIRRRAYILIKKAFDANGIKPAFPTVEVAGGEPSAAAVAQQDGARQGAAGGASQLDRAGSRDAGTASSRSLDWLRRCTGAMAG